MIVFDRVKSMLEMIDIRLKLWTSYNVIIANMITWKSRAVLGGNETDKNCNESLCIRDPEYLNDPLHISGFVLLCIALIFGLIIILSPHLHSSSTQNAIFMIITSILMTIAIALLNPRGCWYEQTLAAIVPTLLTIFAMLMGLRLKDSLQKRTMLLFTLCCLLVAAGIAFSVLAVKFKFPNNLIFAILSFICWCCAMFIVITFTSYNFRKCFLVYLTFLTSIEFMILLIISQFHVNFCFHCCNKSTDTNTTIENQTVIEP
ncbi:unnamed protein product [Schistosoma turkestanicum]|nr:unnamed protein product [Schistosoma turkestanicum]